MEGIVENPVAGYRKALKGKVVKALDAYRCCRAGRLKQKKMALQFANFVEDAVVSYLAGPLEPPPNVFFGRGLEIQLPNIAPEIGVEIQAAPGKLLVGKTWPLSGEGLYSFTTDPNAAPECQASAVRALAEVMDKDTEKDCYNCVKKHLLKQSKKRKRGVWKAKDGTVNPIRIRVPHK